LGSKAVAVRHFGLICSSPPTANQLILLLRKGGRVV
jgi:hypothetical protein